MTINSCTFAPGIAIHEMNINNNKKTMDETVKNEVSEEIEHQGEDTQKSPLMLKLDQYRITPDKQLPKMDFLFRLFGKPCFPRRELVAITGKAKSGKTFVSSMLIACCQQRDVLSFHRECETPLRVLWYDTEQSDESTQDILKNRIMRMTGGDAVRQPTLFDGPRTEPSLDIFNVRAAEWKLRRALLIDAVNMCKPDLVIVDGIRDLVNDINDGVLAQEVMEELLHLATSAECCIACVLHQNKSGEDHYLRGWIGTELMNKAFEIYSCEKMMPQRIFKLEQTQTRKYDIERKMYYEVTGDGLPVMSGEPPVDTAEFPQLNQEYKVTEDDGGWHMDVRRLFSDVLSGHDQISGSELRDEVCRRGNIVSWKFYNSLLNKAIDEKVILKSFDHVGHVIYTMAPF